MIDVGTYAYKGWKYEIFSNWNRTKQRILDKNWNKIELEKQKDWSFILKTKNKNLILIQDREHFHILDINNPNKNQNKICNYGIEFDPEIIAIYLRESSFINDIFWTNIYTRQPLKEPNDMYLFIDIFSEIEIEKWLRKALWSIRIINKQNNEEDVLYKINEIIINELIKMSSEKIIEIKTYNKPVLLKHGKSYLVQDYVIVYKNI